jgi:hypothetical protein
MTVFATWFYNTLLLAASSCVVTVPEQTAKAVVARIEQVVAVHHAEESHAVTVLLVQPIAHLLHMLRPHV